MATGSQAMTSFYAKRIIGDSANSLVPNDGLLQVNVSDTKLVTRSHNNNSAYYIAYVDDTNAGIDIIEFQNINLELTNTAGDTLTFSTSTIESSGELSVNATSTSAVVFGGNIHTNGAITIGNLQGLNLILDNHSIFAREWDSTNEEYIDSALSLGGDTSIDGYLNVVGDFYSGGDIYLAEAKSIFMNYTVPGEEGEEGTPTDFPILVNNDDGTVSLNSLTGALYLGYLNTEEIHIYTSDSIDRYDWIEINADGPYATTNLGVGGQDPDYVFYVNGTSYFSDDITSTKTIWFGSNTSTGKAILGYNSTYPNYGIWYFEDTNDIMTLSASGNADDGTTADFGINVHGAGTLTNRNNRIPHTGNTTGTVGGGEQPVYVNAGTISNTTYALKATVNNGDANYVAYYSGERALSSSKAATAMIMPAHYYHNLYNNNPTTGTTVYVHYYNGDTTSTNTFANLRVKSGSSYKVLAFGGDGALTWGGTMTASGTIHANGGYLKSTLNSNTVQIGSQNASLCHITNSANIPFWFNRSIYMEKGTTIGAADTVYRPFKLFLGRNTTSGSNALDANSPLIEFSNSDRSQYCQLIYDDYDSLIDPDSLTLVGNQNGIKFILKNGPMWVQGGSNAGGNINRLETTAGMPTNMRYNQSKRGTQIYSNGIAFADPYNGNSNSDAGWIRHQETTSNAGELEIAVGDDGDETIVVRQYNTSNGIKRTLTLLSKDGYTFIPSYLNIGGHEKNASSPTYVWGSNSSDNYLRSYQTSKLSVATASSCSGNAATASKVGEAATWLYFNHSNEVNFGGTGTSDTIYFGYRATDSRPKPATFIFGTGTGTATVKAATFVGALTGNVTGNCSGSSGSCTGNAASATKLQTARSLWGNSFNGTGDITGAINCSDIRGGNVRLTSNWVGFYQNANAGGSRYGYIQCKADRMYFRKENGVSTYHFDMNGGYLLTSRCYNAVWNDYAECRQVETEEPGRCVTESKSGTMIITTKRLQAGCKVISDTYGTCIGATNLVKTPIAVSGRVLAYPYRNRTEYPLGAAVCSAPNGTVDIMSRDEIMMYPERIVGTVSEIPDYEIWHAGSNELPEDIDVNGRIWIYVR